MKDALAVRDQPHPSLFGGRSAFLERLIKLSGKGWSTIALVGRRGVGKSRILYQLYSPRTSPTGSAAAATPAGSEAASQFAISVWMAAPSKFDEEDFIESTFEQFALNTESAVARYLGAKRETRRPAAPGGPMARAGSLNYHGPFRHSSVYALVDVRSAIAASGGDDLLVPDTSDHSRRDQRYSLPTSPICNRSILHLASSETAFAGHTLCLLYRRIRQVLTFIHTRKVLSRKIDTRDWPCKPLSIVAAIESEGGGFLDPHGVFL